MSTKSDPKLKKNLYFQLSRAFSSLLMSIFDQRQLLAMVLYCTRTNYTAEVKNSRYIHFSPKWIPMDNRLGSSIATGSDLGDAKLLSGRKTQY